MDLPSCRARLSMRVAKNDPAGPPPTTTTTAGSGRETEPPRAPFGGLEDLLPALMITLEG